MEQAYLWHILIVFILGGIFVFLLITLIPLVIQLKKTAHQLEITAATVDRVLRSELKALLSRGEKVLEEFEDIPPLVKDKLTQVSGKAGQFAFKGISGYLMRAVAIWCLKKAWRKIRGKEKGY